MLQIKNLSKAYKTKGGVVTRALDGVSVDFPEKGLVFLLGKSGSGKSTLLNMIGGLDRPDSGERKAISIVTATHTLDSSSKNITSSMSSTLSKTSLWRFSFKERRMTKPLSMLF